MQDSKAEQEIKLIESRHFLGSLEQQESIQNTMVKRTNDQVSTLDQDFAALMRERAEKDKERGDVDEIKRQMFSYIKHGKIIAPNNVDTDEVKS